MTTKSLFSSEERVIREAGELLDSFQDRGTMPVRHFQSLVSEYEKLFRQTRRLVSVSDKMQLTLHTLTDELNVMRQTAEEATRAKSRFLARMSHEIRTPMAGIIGFTDLLQGTTMSEEQAEYVDDLRMSAHCLMDLLNDILDLTKIEAGKLDLSPTQFSLDECIYDTLRTATVQAQSKGLELVYYVHPSVPATVLADRTRMRQVLLNLVGNAVKFTPRGSIEVKISPLEFCGDEVCLHCSVSDTGVGIPADRQERVFGEFEQVGPFAAATGGTGLGLAICSKLVHLMGGRIWVESELGAGTTFHFTVRVVSCAAGEECIDESKELGLEGKRVLLLDASDMSRAVLDQVLRDRGVITTCSDCGRSALEAVEKACEYGTHFDAIVIDCPVSDSESLEPAAGICSDPALSSAKFVVLAATAQRSQAVGLADSERLVSLAKPVKHSELLRKLAILCGTPVWEESEAPTPVQPRAVATRPLRILLAEDNLVNQKLAQLMLEKAGHKVTTVQTGRELLERLESGQFDLVLTDIEMPDIDGLDAVRALREREEHGTPRITVIAMTGHAMAGDKERFLAAGMDGYLSKPITYTDLLAAVDLVAARLGSDEAQS